MTAATTFDTLKAIQTLEASGIERRQAEAIAGQLREAASADHADRADLATKSDLHAELAPIRTELVQHVTRGEFYRALWIQGGALVAILAALRFLPA